MSTAEDIAASFDHDAHRFKTRHGGYPLDDVCIRQAGDYSSSEPENDFATPYRWKFTDGSAIVVYRSAPDAPLQWTLGLDDAPDGCFCAWHGKGEHDVRCPSALGTRFEMRVPQAFRALLERVRGKETASGFIRRIVEEEARRIDGCDPARAMLLGFSMGTDGCSFWCRSCGVGEGSDHDAGCPVAAVLGPTVGVSRYRSSDGLAEPLSTEASAPAEPSEART